MMTFEKGKEEWGEEEKSSEPDETPSASQSRLSLKILFIFK